VGLMREGPGAVVGPQRWVVRGGGPRRAA
jgi:hypothetical protein